MTTAPTSQYLALLDTTDPSRDQAAYLTALQDAMPAMEQQQYLDTAIAVVRRFHPDAVSFGVAANDAFDTGYFLCEIVLSTGEVLDTDEQVMPVYNATWPPLMAITWGGPLINDGHNGAVITMPEESR